MVNEKKTDGMSYQEAKEKRSVLKRAYDLHFRRGLAWTAVEKQLALKIAGGMTALHCAERYIDVTDDPQVRDEGKEWRRHRRIALSARKKNRAASPSPEKTSQTKIETSSDSEKLRRIDERVDQRLREFTRNLARAISISVG